MQGLKKRKFVSRGFFTSLLIGEWSVVDKKAVNKREYLVNFQIPHIVQWSFSSSSSCSVSFCYAAKCFDSIGQLRGALVGLKVTKVDKSYRWNVEAWFNGSMESPVKWGDGLSEPKMASWDSWWIPSWILILEMCELCDQKLMCGKWIIACRPNRWWRRARGKVQGKSCFG